MVKAKVGAPATSTALGKAEARRIKSVLDDIVPFALALPEVEESTSYGQPAVKCRGHFLFALRKDLETLSLSSSFEARAELLKTHPETFFITDHYLNYPACVVRLATADKAVLREAVKAAWEKLSEQNPRKSKARVTRAKARAR